MIFFLTLVNGKTAIDGKITNLKTKIIPWKVYSTLSNCNVTVNLKELHSNFVSVPIDKAANNVAIICVRLYALVIVKELRFNSGNSKVSYGSHGILPPRKMGGQSYWVLGDLKFSSAHGGRGRGA